MSRFRSCAWVLLGLLVPWAAADAGPPADGTYAGTTFAGFDVVVEVVGGEVASWGAGHSVASCVTITGSTVGGCTTTGSSFSCGNPVFCAPDGAPRFLVSGTFVGDTVSGTFDFRFQGPVITIPPPCCSSNGVMWSATLVSDVIFADGFEAPA